VTHLDPPRSRAVHVLLPALLLAVTGACSGGSAESKPPPQPVRRPAAPVAVAAVEQKEMPIQIQAIGVRKGDLLFSMDPRSYEATLAQAQANLAKDQVQVQQARAVLQRDVARVGQARANLVRDQAQATNARAQQRRRPTSSSSPRRRCRRASRAPSCFVVKPDATVEMRRVVTARTRGNETIVASGLQAGEQVVTDGHTRLTGGAEVEVRAPAGRPGGGARPREAGGGAPAKLEGAKDPAATKTAPTKDAKDTPRR